MRSEVNKRGRAGVRARAGGGASGIQRQGAVRRDPTRMIPTVGG